VNISFDRFSKQKQRNSPVRIIHRMGTADADRKTDQEQRTEAENCWQLALMIFASALSSITQSVAKYKYRINLRD